MQRSGSLHCKKAITLERRSAQCPRELLRRAGALSARLALRVSGTVERLARNAGRSSQSQQHLVHLRGELAALGFRLRKAEDPVKNRAQKAYGNRQVEVLELGLGGLPRVEHGHGNADQGIEAESGGHLQLAVAPADG